MVFHGNERGEGRAEEESMKEKYWKDTSARGEGRPVWREKKLVKSTEGMFEGA